MASALSAFATPSPPRHVSVRRAAGRGSTFILSRSMAAGHSDSGRSVPPSGGRPFGLCPSLSPSPLCSQSPRGRYFERRLPRLPGRPTSTALAFRCYLFRWSPIRWKLRLSLSLSLILSPSPHCPSHKFEYSTWPERATARAAPDGGLGLGGVLFLTESEVILSASSGSGKWPGTVFPKYRGENEFKQKIRRQRDVCHRLKSVTRPNLGR